MSARRTALAALATAVALASSAAGAQHDTTAANAAVRHAAAVWRDVHTVRAAFEQTVSNSLTGTTAHARGDYQQRRPDRLSVKFADPNGDRIVADGAWLWLYLPSSTPGQVIKQAEPANGSGTVDVTAEFLDRPFERYTVGDAGPDSVDGRAARAVVLTPNASGPKDFTRAKVWIDDADGYIRQFEVVQANGVTRRVRLTSLEVNVPTDDSAFHFVVPKGARVVAR